MTQILFVGMGGFLGSVTRFLLAGLVQGATAGTFPLGTLVVNVTGCVAIGGLTGLLETRPFLTGDARVPGNQVAGWLHHVLGLRL